MTRYQDLLQELGEQPATWLVTGAAGFIGSHLVQSLLAAGQRVRGLDNFATGHRRNLEDVRQRSGSAWERFELVEGDICSPEVCRSACEGTQYVLHQAALGSVPRSIEDPVATHEANVTGFLNMLNAARDAECRRMVYASSSSVYGDHPGMPKEESQLGQPLSPYAASKRIDEVYAAAYRQAYGSELVGLRYFNVFGPRQDPQGPYAAVIPRWIETFVRGEVPVINGDGETSRDFCPVENVVQINLLAATADEEAVDRAYNVALGARTDLNELFRSIREILVELGLPVAGVEPRYQEFRAGDVRHSLADIGLATDLLGYAPEKNFRDGLRNTVRWFVETNSTTVS